MITMISSVIKESSDKVN